MKYFPFPKLWIFFGMTALAGTSCVSRVLHSDLKYDREILPRLWTLKTEEFMPLIDRGTEFSNMLVVEDTLIFGNRSQGLIALYPGTARVRYRLPVRNGVQSEIAQDKNHLAFVGGDGFLYLLKLENGKVLWKSDLRNPSASKPTFAEGKVLVNTSDDTVTAHDVESGRQVWQYKRKFQGNATVHGASQPLVKGDDVYLGFSDGAFVCLKLTDGTIRWERTLNQARKFNDVNATAVLMEDGLLYVPSYDGSLNVLKAAGGESVWRFDAGGARRIQYDAERIYLSSSNGAVYAIEKNAPKQIWKFELDEGVPSEVVVADNGYLYVSSSSHYLYVLNKQTGKALSRFYVGYGSGFSSTLGYDPIRRRLYALSSGGNLYSFKVVRSANIPVAVPAADASALK